MAWSDFVIVPYFPTFSRMWPRTRVTYPLSVKSVSSLWTFPIWSFQSVRRTVPVSSPTVASTSFRASPNFDVISRSSLNPRTLTRTFTCLVDGVRSFTLVIALSSMFSLLPTQAAESQRPEKPSPGEFRRCGLCPVYEPLLQQRSERSGATNHLVRMNVRTNVATPRAGSRRRRQLFSASSGSLRAHAGRRLRTRGDGHPRQRHEAMQFRLHLLPR